MRSLFMVIDIALGLYSWAVIIAAILSWLVAFDVLNRNNRLVYAVSDSLNRIVEPALRRIRRVVPLLGTVDISPIILLLLIVFVRSLLVEYGPHEYAYVPH